MDRIDALKELLAKVEAGDRTASIKNTPLRGFGGLFQKAYNGSLDAAKALHEAVLPEWDIMVHTYDDDLFEGSVAEPDKAQTFDGQSTSMARAWLIAIIKALTAKETT